MKTITTRLARLALAPAVALTFAFAATPARADQSVTFIWAGATVPVPGALARDGYIATHWAGPDAQRLQIVSASCMLDTFNASKGKNYDGLGWYDSQKNITVPPGATWYVATRVFQYRPGVFCGSRVSAAGGAGDLAVENLDLAGLAAFWTQIQGTDVSRAEVGAPFTIDSMGLGAIVTGGYPAAPLILIGTPGATPPAPETAGE
jgi:putative globular PEP-CTERM protein (TIGR04254 family)